MDYCPPRPPACPTSFRVCRRNHFRLGLVAGGGFDDGVCIGDGAGGGPRKRTPPIAACTLGRPMPWAPDRRSRRLYPPGRPVRRAVCPRSSGEDNSHRRLRKHTRPTAVCNRWPHAKKAPAVAVTRRYTDSAWAPLGGLPVLRPGVMSFCAGLPGEVACSCGPIAGGILRPSNFWTSAWIRHDRAVEIRKQKTPM